MAPVDQEDPEDNMEISMPEIDTRPDREVGLERISSLIFGPDLTDKQRQDVRDVFTRHAEVLADPKPGSVRKEVAIHPIPFRPGEKLSSLTFSSFRLPLAQQKAVEEEIEKLKKAGMIEWCSAEYSSPAFVVEKKYEDGKVTSYRLVVNYKKINDLTMDDQFPLPKIEDLLASLAHSTVFSKINLKSGFWHPN